MVTSRKFTVGLSVTAILAFACVGNAQIPADMLDTKIGNQLADIRRGDRGTNHVTNQEFRDADPDIFLALLDKSIDDPSAEVANAVHGMIHRLGQMSEDTEFRKKVTARLLATPGWLGRYYDSSDFTPETKEKLRGLVNYHEEPTGGYVLALGAAGISEEVPYLDGLLGLDATILVEGDFTYWQSKLEWDALRALGRLGDDEAAERCIELVDSYRSPVEVAQEWKTTKTLGHIEMHLVYVRHPLVIDYLVGNYLMSDEPIFVSSAGETSVAGYKAAYLLSQMLEDFPELNDRVKTFGMLAITEEELQRVRTWASQQQTWNIRK